MKTKLEELRAETERMVSSDSPIKSDIENLLKKIQDVETVQKDSEKSLADHETTRFESANSSVTSGTVCFIITYTVLANSNFTQVHKYY